MIFKAQFFFNQFNQGWVETWYISTTSIDAATKLATNIASNLVDIRADTCSIIGFRLVTVDATTPKQTIRIAVSIPGDRLTIGQGKLTGSENEDVTQTC